MILCHLYVMLSCQCHSIACQFQMLDQHILLVSFCLCISNFYFSVSFCIPGSSRYVKCLPFGRFFG